MMEDPLLANIGGDERGRGDIKGKVQRRVSGGNDGNLSQGTDLFWIPLLNRDF
jgi:hypothetical protein